MQHLHVFRERINDLLQDKKDINEWIEKHVTKMNTYRTNEVIRSKNVKFACGS